MPEWKKTNSLFLQEWWWKAVCPEESFRLLETGKGSFWPMAKIRRLGVFHVYAMPSLTQHAGPYLPEREDFMNLLERIPDSWQLHLNVGFKLDAGEILAAERRGLRVKERHSQRIEDLSDLERVFAAFKPARQRQIRKAERLLSVRQDDDIEQLIRLQAETFRRQGKRSPYPPRTVRRLYEAVMRHDAGRLITLVDASGTVMACGLFVHDDTTCYSLTHGFHKTSHDTGAGSLLQWEGIRLAASRKLVFDFEGSDIESIKRFNLSFGATTGTYSKIERATMFFRFLERLRAIF